MTRSFRETHETRLRTDPEYAVAYSRDVYETEAKMVTALRNARIGLAMWSMSTQEIDALIGPMNEEDRAKARGGRGGPLWDEGGEPAASGTQASDAISQAFAEMKPGMSGPFDECQIVEMIASDMVTVDVCIGGVAVHSAAATLINPQNRGADQAPGLLRKMADHIESVGQFVGSVNARMTKH